MSKIIEELIDEEERAAERNLADNAMVFQRLDRIELKQFEAEEKFKIIFSQLEQSDAYGRNLSEKLASST